MGSGVLGDWRSGRWLPEIKNHSHVLPEVICYEYLAEDGGNSYMSVEASIESPAKFKFTVPEGYHLHLQSLRIAIVDGGIALTGFAGEDILTNGCLFQILNAEDEIITHFATDTQPIVITAQLATLSETYAFVDKDLANVDVFIVNWKMNTSESHIVMREGYTFQIVIQDDLSDIDFFRAVIQGELIQGIPLHNL